MIMIYFCVFVAHLMAIKLFIHLIKNEKIFVRKSNVDTIKKSCIKELHKNKQNTPIMGGLPMNIVLLAVGSVMIVRTRELSLILIPIVLFGLLGFIDDYTKIKKPQDGIKARTKLFWLGVISSFFVLSSQMSGYVSSEINVVFLKNNIGVNPVFFALTSILLIVIITNSANITDGVDGLLLSMALVIFSFIFIVALFLGKRDVAIISLCIHACCLGAFIFNKNPAKIFLGDTGSFFLGGSAAVLLISLNMHIPLILVTAVWGWELVTVVIQLLSLRFRKKKVFLIAPYHHHLEKKNWAEKKIVMVFSSITLIINVGVILFVIGGLR